MSDLDALIRDVTGALTVAPATAVRRRHGIVTAIATGPPPTVTVTVGATTIPGVHYLASYAPTVGDEVIVDWNGADLIVVGTEAPGGAGVAVTGYTPTLKAVTVNPTLGTGHVATGRWKVDSAGWVTGWFEIQFGSGGGAAAGTGAYAVGLPVPALETVNDQQMGQGVIAFGSDARIASLTHLLADAATDCRILFTSATAPTVTHNNPYAWGPAALLSFNFSYERAP